MLPSTPHRVFDPIAETEQRKQLNVYFRWSTMHENILHPDALLRRYTSVSEKHYGQEKQVQIKKTVKQSHPFLPHRHILRMVAILIFRNTSVKRKTVELKQIRRPNGAVLFSLYSRPKDSNKNHQRKEK